MPRFPLPPYLPRSSARTIRGPAPTSLWTPSAATSSSPRTGKPVASGKSMTYGTDVPSMAVLAPPMASRLECSLIFISVMQTMPELCKQCPNMNEISSLEIFIFFVGGDNIEGAGVRCGRPFPIRTCAGTPNNSLPSPPSVAIWKTSMEMILY
jgi:hypothetical protein